jgi:hypothetical protein
VLCCQTQRFAYPETTPETNKNVAGKRKEEEEEEVS